MADFANEAVDEVLARLDRQHPELDHQDRPLRCRWGFHDLADSVRDPRTDYERWRTICKRCGAMLCYSPEPFIVDGKVTPPPARLDR